MDIFMKTAAAAMMTTVLGLVLAKQGKDMTVLITLAACAMIAAAAVLYLQPVIQFFYRLIDLTNLNEEHLKIIFKTVGIGLIGELVTLVCNDAGNAALGKTLQILTSAVVLWLSIPLFESFLELVQSILGEV
jgi:stage III sporulation protein AD